MSEIKAETVRKWTIARTKRPSVPTASVRTTPVATTALATLAGRGKTAMRTSTSAERIHVPMEGTVSTRFAMSKYIANHQQ